MTLNLTDVRSDVRLLIEQYSKGHIATMDLVSQESLRNREHITSVVVNGQEKVKLHVTQELVRTKNSLQEDIRRDLVTSSQPIHTALHNLALDSTSQTNVAKCERLLRSLKYLGFNERRNQVRDAYDQTYQWIFAGDDGGIVHEKFRNKVKKMHNSVKMGSLKWDSFSNWLMSTNTFYWISGKPGSGKTTLVKYILSSQKTKQYLNIWKTDVVIISHFFWRPGSDMQRNTKGLLCSLLFQLLSESPEALGVILSALPSARLKDSDSDWSIAELLSAYRHTMRVYDRPICVFLDGIDEYMDTNDSVIELLSLVHQLAQAKNAKFCLSSRPDPLLLQRLTVYAQLRLQDLTQEDLTLYAEGHLLPGTLERLRKSSKEGTNIVASLVHKAEGVFLWLCLAIKNINKGYTLGDDFDTIEKRIDSLPSELHSLYRDMWEKACADDPQECRRFAALYFRLVIHYSGPRDSKLSCGVLELMLASTEIADMLLGSSRTLPRPPPANSLINQCQETQRKVAVYCAGLLEVITCNGYVADMESWHGGEYEQLLPFVGENTSLRFIHRTASDFLLDTTEGRNILAHCTLSGFDLEIRLTNAQLAKSCLFEWYDLPDETPLSPFLWLRNIRSDFEGSIGWDTGKWNQLISHCKRLSDSQRLFAWSNTFEVRPCLGHDFLLAAAAHRLDHYVHSALQEDKLDGETKSRILVETCQGPVWEDFIPYSESVRKLLEAGADPRWRKHRRFGDPPKQLLRSPIASYLNQMGSLHRDSRYEALEVLHTLDSFLAHGSSVRDQIGFCLVDSSTTRDGLEYRFSSPEAFNRSTGLVMLAYFPVHSVITKMVQKLSSRFNLDMGEKFPYLDQIMDDQGTDLGSHYRLFMVEIDQCNRRYAATGPGIQPSDMRFWESPTTEQLVPRMQMMLEHLIDFYVDVGWRVRRPELAKFASECQAELQRLDHGEGDFLNRLEELGLASDTSSEWSTYEELVAETKKMVRDQQARYEIDDILEDIKTLW